MNSILCTIFLTTSSCIQCLPKVLKLYTMSAKSLGILPISSTICELQNLMPSKTMLFEGDMKSLQGEVMSLKIAKGFGLVIQDNEKRKD